MTETGWKRKGLFYYAIMRVGHLTRTRKLDFLAYWLIYWYHGPE